MEKENKKEELKKLLWVVWKFLVIPALYSIAMWASLVVCLFLIFGDLWRAAGIVSSFVLFYMIRAEFTKEFFGDRNHGLQEQTQRK